MAFTTNIEVALLSSLNDLGRRFGLRPWEFLAEYKTEDGSVRIDNNSWGPEIDEKRKRMMDALGCGPDGIIPSDKEEEGVFAKIEEVLSASPRVWSR